MPANISYDTYLYAMLLLLLLLLAAAEFAAPTQSPALHTFDYLHRRLFY